MSAPPLPDIFGNYALGDFVEVTAPAAVSWWPQTVGWIWVGVLLGLLLARKLWRMGRHWYHNRYRREALQRLTKIEAGPLDETTPEQLNRLLKLTALAGWSRDQVARLTGSEWVEFLNRTCESPPFGPTLAELLATGPYTAPAIDPATGRRLLQACREWIRHHRGPANV